MYISEDPTPCNRTVDLNGVVVPEYDPEMWFAKQDTRAAANAKKLCLEQCAERLDCLASTLRWEQSEGYIQPGIFGGLTEYERRKLLKQKGRKSKKEAA